MYKKYEMFVKLYIPNPKEIPSGQDKFENRKRYKGNCHKSNCLFLKNNPKTCKLYMPFRCHQPRKERMSTQHIISYTFQFACGMCVCFYCIRMKGKN